MQASQGAVLLDFSVFTLGRLMAEKLDWANVDAIWISHFHLDHIGGLPAFLFGSRHAEEMKNRKKPLRIFGGTGLEKLLQGFDDLSKNKLHDQPFPLEIVEVEPLEKFEIAPGIEAVAMVTPHTDESLAIHLRDRDGSTLVYTADTGFADTLASFARRVDLLVIESSYPKDKPKNTHLEFAEAMHVIRRAEPKRAVVTHLYPLWDGIDLTAEAEKYSPPCEVIEARDGLRIDTA